MYKTVRILGTVLSIGIICFAGLTLLMTAIDLIFSDQTAAILRFNALTLVWLLLGVIGALLNARASIRRNPPRVFAFFLEFAGLVKIMAAFFAVFMLIANLGGPDAAAEAVTSTELESQGSPSTGVEGSREAFLGGLVASRWLRF